MIDLDSMIVDAKSGVSGAGRSKAWRTARLSRSVVNGFGFLHLTERGCGVRSQRYSMMVDNGVVKVLNLEKPGQFEVSSAEKMLEQL